MYATNECIPIRNVLDQNFYLKKKELEIRCDFQIKTN